MQNPATAMAAESVLLQFRQSSRPVAACRQLLDHSSVVEARFHAACTLREALIREWAALSHEEVGVFSFLSRKDAQSFLLHTLHTEGTNLHNPDFIFLNCCLT